MINDQIKMLTGNTYICDNCFKRDYACLRYLYKGHIYCSICLTKILDEEKQDG